MKTCLWAYADSKGPDESVHLRCLIRTFTVCLHNHWILHITKTYLYNSDPLKPHFYMVKLGFTGVYFIFISAQKHSFEQKYEKISVFLSENFQFLEVKFSIYLNRHVFVMRMYEWRTI